jgi:hypothetical protein
VTQIGMIRNELGDKYISVLITNAAHFYDDETGHSQINNIAYNVEVHCFWVKFCSAFAKVSNWNINPLSCNRCGITLRLFSTSSLSVLMILAPNCNNTSELECQLAYGLFGVVFA